MCHSVDMTQRKRREVWSNPTRTVAARVQELRRKRGWSAEALAEECADLGMPALNRSVIANIESGRRTYVSVEELLTLAYALDVAPVVYLEDDDRGAAAAEALTAAALIGELGIPVFLYGDLATDESRRERADIRRGGPAILAERVEAGELVPDYGPAEIHPSAGATLVTARPPS